MSGKLIKNGFKEVCKAFFGLKGVVQPRCACNSCWDFYFSKNPSKVVAAELALRTLSEEAVILVQGKEYGEAQYAQQQFEFIYGTRKCLNTVDVLIRARGTKYVKKLKRWLKDNPVAVTA